MANKQLLLQPLLLLKQPLPHRLLLLLLPSQLLLLLLLQSKKPDKLDKKADASRLFCLSDPSAFSDDLAPIQSMLLCRHCHLLRCTAQYPA